MSSAPPNPCVPFTAIVRTLSVITIISRLRVRVRFLVALYSMMHRSALPRRFRLHATNFLLFMTFPVILISLLSFLSLDLVSRCGFSCLYRSGSSVCSRARFLPPAFRGVTPVLGRWPLVQIVWLVGSTENALPTPSDAQLA